jgi:hypothetical protein
MGATKFKLISPDKLFRTIFLMVFIMAGGAVLLQCILRDEGTSARDVGAWLSFDTFIGYGLASLFASVVVYVLFMYLFFQLRVAADRCFSHNTGLPRAADPHHHYPQQHLFGDAPRTPRRAPPTREDALYAHDAAPTPLSV